MPKKMTTLDNPVSRQIWADIRSGARKDMRRLAAARKLVEEQWRPACGTRKGPAWAYVLELLNAKEEQLRDLLRIYVSPNTRLLLTVPPTNHLGFFEVDTADAAAVLLFLPFMKEEISRALDVPMAKVKYGRSMPPLMRRWVHELGFIYEMVADFFKGDTLKTKRWLKAKNPMLGGLSARDMICFGRHKKLMQFVMNAAEANRGPFKPKQVEIDGE